MKELPVNERPYEKCRLLGVESLSNAELLAILLRSGTREVNSLELAMRVIKAFEDQGGLTGLQASTQSQLMQIPGIGQVKAAQILACLELGKRIHNVMPALKPLLQSAEAIAEYYQGRFQHCGQEEVHLLFLDNKNRLIQEKLLTKGTVNASLISPRELFIEALKYCAVHVVMVHNHPSGDPAPSQEDILMTSKVKQAGELLDIPLLDHIIMGNPGYVSLHSLGYL